MTDREKAHREIADILDRLDIVEQFGILDLLKLAAEVNVLRMIEQNRREHEKEKEEGENEGVKKKEEGLI